MITSSDALFEIEARAKSVRTHTHFMVACLSLNACGDTCGKTNKVAKLLCTLSGLITNTGNKQFTKKANSFQLIFL